MSESSIQIHPLTENPTAAWNEIRQNQKVIRLNVKPPSDPPKDNMLRFVCMSDTHSLTSHLQMSIPDGDVFIHAGDFTRCGNTQEVEEFNSWLDTLPHKHKIVIAGNHELSFDTRFTGISRSNSRQSNNHKSAHTGTTNLINEIPDLGMERNELQDAVQCSNITLLTNTLYLQDESTSICGIKIYGSPWQPEFHNWAFNLKRGQECLDMWNKIPAGTDVVITHTPPIGHGDLCCTGVRAGCVELLETIQKRVKPKYHIFGHIHEGYGVTSDQKIIYINASTCNINYVPCNPPIVFDVPIPAGHSKQ